MNGSPARVLAQGAWETRLLLRNGEQLLLTILIPIGILLLLGATDLMPESWTDTGTSGGLANALAVVLAVAIISTSFTSLAIATGFERRAGALRLLATTPMSRSDLLLGKLTATLAATVLAGASVAIVAMALGWRPGPGSMLAVPVALLGVAAWVPWALVLAGVLRAEAVLAIANGVFLVVVAVGGVVVPSSSLPSAWGTVVSYLPSGALTEALTAALVGGAFDTRSALVLAAWAVIGTLVATRTFRWT